MQALDGGNGATGGGGGRGSPLTCTEMESAYAKALALTKNCTAMAGAQCTKSVPNQLACPCPTFVNPTNATALNELESLEAAWNASICDEEVSCTAGCPTPSGASCVASSGSGPGKCTDSL